MNKRKRLGELLLEAGVIDEFQLSAALNDQRRWGNRLGTSLIRLGYTDEKTLTRCLSKQYGLPGIDLDRIVPQRKALETLSPEIARQRLALPLAFKEEQGRTVLLVALGDPQNIESLDEIRFATNHPLQIRLASDHAILRAIDRYYLGKGQVERAADPSALHHEAADTSMVIIRGVDEELAESERVRSGGRPPVPDVVSSPPPGPPPKPEKPAPRGAEPTTAEEVLASLKALVRLLVRKRLLSLEELQAELKRR